MKSVFWITGNYFDCQKQWQAILAEVENPQIDILDCGYLHEEGAASAGDIIKILKTRNIFDKQPHIIKVKGIPPPDESEEAARNKTYTAGYKLLLPYLKLTSDKKILVIDGPIGYRSKPPSKRFNSVKTSTFFKEVKKVGEVYEFPMEVKNNSMAIQWLIGVFTSFKKKVDPSVASLIVLAKGRGLDELYTTALTLKDYVKGKEIKKEDVETVCSSVFNKTVWDLTSSIDQRDYESAITHLQRFYQQPRASSEFFGEVVQLLGALHYHFQTLLLLKDGGEGLSYAKVKKVLEGMQKRNKEKEWKSMYTPYSIGAIAKNADISNMLRLPRMTLCEYFTDINRVRLLSRTKFSNSVSGIRMCLDTLIMVLCGKLSLKGAATIRSYSGNGGLMSV